MSGIRIGLIGGSGLGEAVVSATSSEIVRRHELDTPFGKPSDAIIETNWHGVSVFVLARHGPGHLLNPSQVPYRANVFALKQLGVTHVIASGAVGSLRDEFRPRDLVIPDQIIDRTTRRAGTFFDHAAVHVEFAEPFCPVLRRTLVEAAIQESGVSGQASQATESSLTPDSRPLTPEFKVHNRGCYVCMEGPTFSTRAESLMHRLWGGDLIGMTAMPEAKLAREAELSYALVALVTDYDCWRRAPAAVAGEEDATDPSVLLKEIIANLKAASDNAVKLIRRAVQRIAANPNELAASPAREALRLAIWSDKSRVPPTEVERLAPLWKHYFEQ
jgi:5'-methylthioadenosine phosphorylase